MVVAWEYTSYARGNEYLKVRQNVANYKVQTTDRLACCQVKKCDRYGAQLGI